MDSCKSAVPLYTLFWSGLCSQLWMGQVLRIKYTVPYKLKLEIVSLATNVTPTSCNVLLKLSLCIAHLTYLGGSLVIALRTWAVWNRSRLCGIVVGAAWTGNTVSTLYNLIANAMLGALPMETYDPRVRGCGPGIAPWVLYRVSIWGYSYAAYEAFIFILTLARGIRYLMKPSPLMFLLYRDAFIGSLTLFVVTLLFAIVPSQVAADDSQMAFNYTYDIGVIFYFFVPCRIILNLRETTMELDGWDLTTAPSPSVPTNASEMSRSRDSRVQERGSGMYVAYDGDVG